MWRRPCHVGREGEGRRRPTAAATGRMTARARARTLVREGGEGGYSGEAVEGLSAVCPVEFVSVLVRWAERVMLSL